MQSSNAFRTRFCYIEQTSLVLEANISSIRFLYENYAQVDQSQVKTANARPLSTRSHLSHHLHLHTLTRRTIYETTR